MPTTTPIQASAHKAKNWRVHVETDAVSPAREWGVDRLALELCELLLEGSLSSVSLYEISQEH